MIPTIDLFIKNGFLVTLDPERRVYRDGAVAYEGDRIVAVGSEEEIAAHIGDGTRVIELEQELVDKWEQERKADEEKKAPPAEEKAKETIEPQGPQPPNEQEKEKEGWLAFEVVLPASTERELIPKLKKAGASGIIVYPLNKVIH